MRHTIDNTLKEKLIVNPTPSCSKVEFAQFYARFISDQSIFISFLESQDTKKQYHYAKKIISNLCNDSNYPPSLGLENFLFTFEQEISKERTVKYQSRDHYVHQCYLYLLGLYLFFYNKGLNTRLVSYFTDSRYSQSVREESNSVKCFLSAWKYFVLYHDLGYPIEYFGKENHEFSANESVLKASVEKYFSYSFIEKNLQDMISVKTLSILLALSSSLMSQHRNSSKIRKAIQSIGLKNTMVSRYGQELNSIYSNTDKIYYLQAVRDCSHIKHYLSVFNMSDFFVIIKQSLDIVCVAKCAKEPLLFFTEEFKRKRFFKKIESDISILFDDELHLKYPGYSFEYYGLNLDDRFDEELRKYGIVNGALVDLIQRVGQLTSTATISDNMHFYYYILLNMLRKEIILSDDKHIMIAQIADQDKPLEDYVVESIKSYVLRAVDEIKNKTITPLPQQSDIYESTEQMIRSILKELKSKLNVDNRYNTTNQDIAFCLTNNTLEKLPYSRQMAETQEAQRLFKCIRNEMSFPAIAQDMLSPFERYKKENSTELAIELVDNWKELLEDNFRYTLHSSDIPSICSKYNSPYSCYDHGIVAFWMYLKHMSIYREIVCRMDGNKLLYAGFGIPIQNSIDKQKLFINNKYIMEYDQIIGDVSNAIFIHNLYPNYFDKNEVDLMTRKDQSVFSYFAMLCDALQDWGRPLNINALEEEFPISIDASNYDITVEASDDKIHLTFYEDRPTIISKYIDRYVQSLNQYLEGAGDIVAVHCLSN